MSNPIYFYIIPFCIGFLTIIIYTIIIVRYEHNKRKDGWKPELFEQKLPNEFTHKEKVFSQFIAITLLLCTGSGYYLLTKPNTRMIGEALVPCVLVIWFFLIKLGNKLFMDNNNHTQIIPAVLSDRASDYTAQTKILSKFSNCIHLDVMDGDFVKTKSPDVIDILQALNEYKNVQFAVHLMVRHPLKTLDMLREFPNVALTYVHVETIDEDLFKETYPFEVGIVFNPDTDIRRFKSWFKYVNVIQIMTVYPGKQGNDFIPQALNNIEKTRNFGFDGEIHVDGHINEETIPQILLYRPDVLNVGSSISKAEHPDIAYKKLKEFCN